MYSQERTSQRLAFWQQLGSSREEACQLEEGCRPLPAPVAQLPLPEEPQTEFYRLLPARGQDLYQQLVKAFPQLAFQPTEGLSATSAWTLAVRRGRLPLIFACSLETPEELELRLVTTPAGSLPALVAGCRQDFSRLLQLLAHRGEPVDIPRAQGASLVQGLVNWERFRVLKERWQAEHGTQSWDQAWPELSRQKELYQDRLVVAWRGPYSGVTRVPGLSSAAWEETSLTIRLAHEATHYLTLRLFGQLGHSVLEELVADWVGMSLALGSYRPDLANQFMGVEQAPRVRSDGRLHQYRPPGLSEEGFGLLAKAVYLAIRRLGELPWPAEALLPVWLPRLLATSLEELASCELSQVLGLGP